MTTPATPTEAEMRAVRIVLTLPPAELSPNGRPHWRKKAAAVKRYRTLAKLAALEAIGIWRPYFKKATAQAIWYRKTRREMDGDNALSSLKAAWDGIADSGLLSNDRGLTHLPVDFALDPVWPRVEVLITPQERSPLCG